MLCAFESKLTSLMQISGDDFLLLTRYERHKRNLEESDVTPAQTKRKRDTKTQSATKEIKHQKK